MWLQCSAVSSTTLEIYSDEHSHYNGVAMFGRCASREARAPWVGNGSTGSLSLALVAMPWSAWKREATYVREPPRPLEPLVCEQTESYCVEAFVEQRPVPSTLGASWLP